MMRWFHWMLNDDSPLPPDWYRPNEHPQWRVLCWLARNFAHNLTSYYIGVRGKPFVSYGRYPNTNWNPNGGFNWAIRKLGWVCLPWVSYLGKRVEWYVGWREGGNLGIAFRRRITT